MSSIVNQIRNVRLDLDTRQRCGEFFTLVKFMMLAKGDMMLAARMATHAPPRVQGILKSAISAGSLSDPAWAGALGSYKEILSAFVSSLASLNSFDAMMGDMVEVPFRTSVAIQTLTISASVVGEGSPKPATSLTFSAPSIEPMKVGYIISVSNEFARMAAPAAMGQINRMLQTGVAKATDERFVADLIASVTPTSTAGGSVANLVTDIGTLYAAVDVGVESKLYFLMNSTLAKALSARLAGSVGWSLTPRGGELGGSPVIVSDSVPSGHLILVDASRIAAASDTITVDTSGQALLQMDSDPDDPPTAGTSMVSLWHENKIGVKCERYFGYAQLGDNLCAAISGMT